MNFCSMYSSPLFYFDSIHSFTMQITIVSIHSFTTQIIHSCSLSSFIFYPFLFLHLFCFSFPYFLLIYRKPITLLNLSSSPSFFSLLSLFSFFPKKNQLHCSTFLHLHLHLTKICGRQTRKKKRKR